MVPWITAHGVLQRLVKSVPSTLLSHCYRGGCCLKIHDALRHCQRLRGQPLVMCPMNETPGQIFNEVVFSYKPQLAVRLCLCVFIYLSGIYSTKSTMFSQSWNAFSSSSSNSVCMHVFVCRLFVRRLATETFSSLRTKLHSGYWLSRQPQSLSGTGSVFTLTYTLAQTHTQTHTHT